MDWPTRALRQIHDVCQKTIAVKMGINMKKVYKNYHVIIGSVLTGSLLLLMAAGFFYTPWDPDAMDASAKFAGISTRHLLGADHFGRDLLSRAMKGSGTTLFVAGCTVFIGAFLGVLLGAFTGFYGGITDEILMRINDAVFSFPSVLLALTLISILGRGKYNVILALGIAFVPGFARIVRGEFIKYKNMDYVTSARLQGAGSLRIMFLHILPNTYTVLLPAIMIGFNNAVLAEAGMSYLGIGVQPPEASLGRMLSEAQTYLFRAPGLALVPGIWLVLMILGFTLLGDGLKGDQV